MMCATDGCKNTVIRKSRKGRPPRYCPGCQKGYAANLRTRNGTSHQPPPVPNEPEADRAADRVLLVGYLLEHGPVEGIVVEDAEVTQHLMGARSVIDLSDPLGILLRRDTLRKPVMDLEREQWRGPRTRGTDGWVPGGSDGYYERKRELSLITDARNME